MVNFRQKIRLDKFVLSWYDIIVRFMGGSVALFAAIQIQEVKEMKVQPSVKPICEKCKIIKRKGRVMVICENPKHKQKQG